MDVDEQDERMTDERAETGMGESEAVKAAAGARSGRSDFSRARSRLVILLPLYAAVTSYAVASMFVGLPLIFLFTLALGDDSAALLAFIFGVVNTLLIPGVVGLVIGMRAARGILVHGDFSHPASSYTLPSLWGSAFRALGLAILNLVIILPSGLVSGSAIAVFVLFNAVPLPILAVAVAATWKGLLKLRNKRIAVSAVTAAFCGVAPMAALSFLAYSMYFNNLGPFLLIAALIPPLLAILILLPLLLRASKAYARLRHAGRSMTEG